MLDLQSASEQYLDYCLTQKKLNPKTIRAYRIDLDQFISYFPSRDVSLEKHELNNYIQELHTQYKPKTVKRKIACIRAFYNYLDFEELIEDNPFSKIRVKFKEPFLLPKVIPLHYIEDILKTVYSEYEKPNQSSYSKRAVLRDICVLEMLFATGMRVSELCSLQIKDVDFVNNTFRIWGKGSKERILQIGNTNVLLTLQDYYYSHKYVIDKSGYFFVNRLGNHLSEQSVRAIINKYVEKSGIPIHITPHMFRHSFATFLLEEDVDIRYIQHILGHSSITTTQIYTHVSSTKQKHILMENHPRNKMHL